LCLRDRVSMSALLVQQQNMRSALNVLPQRMEIFFPNVVPRERWTP